MKIIESNDSIYMVDIGEKIFRSYDQNIFADFSGDRNPIHINKEYARRAPVGAPIVHGIHVVLWALNLLVGKHNIFFKEIFVKFHYPIYLDEMVSCRLNNGKTKIEVYSENIIYVSISLTVASHMNIYKGDFGGRVTKIPLNELLISDISEMKRVEFHHNVSLALVEHMFPNLFNKIGSTIVGEIGSLSAVVGMLIPGLHSIFSSFKLRFGSFEKRFIDVTKVDARFGLVVLNVVTDNLSADLSTIVRAAPVTSVPLNCMLNSNLPKLDLNGRNILIIGGTRGLGCYTTKLMALMGANVTFTYANSIEDAITLKKEINKGGYINNFVHFDANSPNFNELFICKPEIIFYFATPKIFVKRSKLFEEILYSRFRKFYVEVLEKILAFSVASNVRGVFVPSTVAIDENTDSMREYIKAKYEGENLLTRYASNETLIIQSPRIPRMLTDQTATNLMVHSHDMHKVMLPLISEFIIKCFNH
jgi:hypothetical protein